VTIRPANSENDIVIAESETIMEYICDHFGKQLVPARYPEGQEGVLGAETEEWMRYKVRCVLLVSDVRWKAYMYTEIGAQFSLSASVTELLPIDIDYAEIEQLTLVQFLMDYTEGSLFTVLILALVTGSKSAPC
jgi:glutathione S-transferase